MGSSWYDGNLLARIQVLGRHQQTLVASMNELGVVITEQAQDIHDLKERCRELEAKAQQSREWDYY